MATVIRLSRYGKKAYPSYRIGVYEKRSKRDGRVIEYIGYYLPLSNPKKISIDQARLEYWVSHGATPSVTVSHLMKAKHE